MEDFLIDSSKAISFENRKITKTYIYFDSDFQVVAYYTLSLNLLNTKNISKSTVKKLDGMDKNRENIASYLIAQLGKSDRTNEAIGKYLIADAIKSIYHSANTVGGRFVVIDAVNHEKVISFYKNNNFTLLDINHDNVENVRMYFPLL